MPANFALNMCVATKTIHVKALCAVVVVMEVMAMFWLPELNLRGRRVARITTNVFSHGPSGTEILVPIFLLSLAQGCPHICPTVGTGAFQDGASSISTSN